MLSSTGQSLRSVGSVASCCQLSSKNSCSITVMNAATLLSAQGSSVCATALRWQLVSPGQSCDDVWVHSWLAAPAVSDPTGVGAQMVPTQTPHQDLRILRRGFDQDEAKRSRSNQRNDKTKQIISIFVSIQVCLKWAAVFPLSEISANTFFVLFCCFVRYFEPLKILYFIILKKVNDFSVM